MRYVGLDVHKGFSRMGAFDPATGELSELGEVVNQKEALASALAQVPGPKTVVLEAGRNSHWFAALLEPMAEAVWIVDPQAVRKLQARVAKTDRRDAAALAYWAAKGVLAPLWRPGTETLELRELTRGKTTLTRLTVQVRNHLRSLLARHGYECPHTDLLGKKAQMWLTQVHIDGYGGVMFSLLLELLPLLQQKAEALEAQVAREAKQLVEAQRLMTIPGVGPFLAVALVAEIGEAKRFASPKALRSYSGLCPTVHQSGERCSYGPLTKKGNRWLRYVAVLAAQRMALLKTADAKLKRTFLSVAFRHGRNPAKVAGARRLLDLVWHLLVQEEEYRPPRMRAMT